MDINVSVYVPTEFTTLVDVELLKKVLLHDKYRIPDASDALTIVVADCNTDPDEVDTFTLVGQVIWGRATSCTVIVKEHVAMFEAKSEA